MVAQIPKIAVDGDNKGRGATAKGRGTIRRSGRKLQENVENRSPNINGREPRQMGNAITLHSNPRVATSDPLVLV